MRPLGRDTFRSLYHFPFPRVLHNSVTYFSSNISCMLLFLFQPSGLWTAEAIRATGRIPRTSIPTSTRPRRTRTVFLIGIPKLGFEVSISCKLIWIKTMKIVAWSSVYYYDIIAHVMCYNRCAQIQKHFGKKMLIFFFEIITRNIIRKQNFGWHALVYMPAKVLFCILCIHCILSSGANTNCLQFSSQPTKYVSTQIWRIQHSQKLSAAAKHYFQNVTSLHEWY